MYYRYLSLIFFALLCSHASAQWLDWQTPDIPRAEDGQLDVSAPVPRTIEGRPDLSGLWIPSAVTGDLPNSDKFMPWLVALREERNRRFNAQNPMNLCLPLGPAYLTEGTSTFGLRRVVHSPKMLLTNFSDLKYRQVFLDGRELEENPIPTWMGYSIGYWEGDTLVIESNGYNDKTWLHRQGIGHTEQLRITERLTRRNFGTVDVEITYEDPGAFTEPLYVNLRWQYVADDVLLEVVCNESSQGTKHYTSDWEDVEAALVELPEELLATYVGTYEGIYIDNLVRVEVTLEDGQLFLQRGQSKQELIPQGERSFIRGGWGYVFSVNEEGEATAVSEVHISGGWTFERLD